MSIALSGVQCSRFTTFVENGSDLERFVMHGALETEASLCAQVAERWDLKKGLNQLQPRDVCDKVDR